MQGWIKLHRQMVNWEWYDDINVKVLFLHLLLTVNYENKKWRGKSVKKGERITSLQKLANETQLSVQQVRTAMRKLEKTGEVTRHPTNEYTHITLVKWAEYQNTDNEATHDLTNEQQTNNKRITTTKERKERKKEKNIYIPKKETPAQIAKDFFENGKYQDELVEFFKKKGMQEESIKHELQKFKLYWTEPNKSGTRVRWEMQKTFEVRRRLVTWFNNAKQNYSQKETKGIVL